MSESASSSSCSIIEDEKEDSEPRCVLPLNAPPFPTTDCRIWFIQMEHLFRLIRVSTQEQMYCYIVIHLPHHIMSDVMDLLDPMPADKPYDKLKSAILERTTPSKRARLEQLLCDFQLGDKTPSQLLRRMQYTAFGLNISNELMSLLWQRFLSTNMQMILAAREGKLDDMATLADRVHDRRGPGVAGKRRKSNRSNTRYDTEKIFNDPTLTDLGRLHLLLDGIKLGDHKPSTLLSLMQSLTGGLSIDDDLMSLLWLRLLPVKMQKILVMSDGKLHDMATIADRIYVNNKDRESDFPSTVFDIRAAHDIICNRFEHL